MVADLVRSLSDPGISDSKEIGAPTVSRKHAAMAVGERGFPQIILLSSARSQDLLRLSDVTGGINGPVKKQER
jgi:hypothetical protein